MKSRPWIRCNAFWAGAAFIVLFLLGFWLVDSAWAQSTRSYGKYYVQPSMGLVHYIGHANPAPLDASAWQVTPVPASYSIELGIQPHTRFNLGTKYRSSLYSALDGEATRFHTASVVARYTAQARHRTLAPYLQGGLHTTFGQVPKANGDRVTRAGIGPFLGAGVDYAVSPRTSVVLGTNLNLTLPEVVSYRRDRHDVELLSDVSLGIRYRFGNPWH